MAVALQGLICQPALVASLLPGARNNNVTNSTINHTFSYRVHANLLTWSFLTLKSLISIDPELDWVLCHSGCSDAPIFLGWARIEKCGRFPKESWTRQRILMNGLWYRMKNLCTTIDMISYWIMWRLVTWPLRLAVVTVRFSQKRFKKNEKGDVTVSRVTMRLWSFQRPLQLSLPDKRWLSCI